MPTGMIVPFGGESPPANFLACNGSAVNRSTFSALFSIIGESYGVGDGATTFNVPDMRGRYPHGLSLSEVEFDTLGNSGGVQEAILDVDHVPVHRHILRGRSSGGDGNTPMSDHGPDSSDSGETGTINPTGDNGVKENTGDNNHDISENNPHNNMPPFQVVTYAIQI